MKILKNSVIEADNIRFKNARGKYMLIIDHEHFPYKQVIKRWLISLKKIKDCFYYSIDKKTLFNLKGIFLDFKDSKKLKENREPLDK